MKAKEYVLYAVIVALLVFIVFYRIQISAPDKAEPILENALDLAVDSKKYDLARDKFAVFLNSDGRTIRAINGIGSTYMAQGKAAEAIPFYQVSWSLGSKDALKYLAGAYLSTNRLDDFSKLIEPLKGLAANDEEIWMMISLYAFWSENKNLYISTVANLTDDFLTKSPVDVEGLIEGCDHFGLNDLKQKYLNMQKTIGKPPESNIPPASLPATTPSASSGRGN